MYLMFYHIHTLNVSIIYYSLKVEETYHGIRYGLHWQVSLRTKCQLGNMIPTWLQLISTVLLPQRQIKKTQQQQKKVIF